MNEAIIDNALVALKNRLLADLNRTYDLPASEAVVVLRNVGVVLDFNKHLFDALDYGYKTRELLDRAMLAANALEARCFSHRMISTHCSPEHQSGAVLAVLKLRLENQLRDLQTA